VTRVDHEQWVDAWSEAVRTSPVALGLVDVASPRLVAVSPEGADVLARASGSLVLWVVLDPAGDDEGALVMPDGLERLGRPPAPALDLLTPRQREVVSRLARGDLVTDIARDMRLSQSTVRNHLSAAFRKVGVHSQRGLLALLGRD
jgi:DNA-binding CsgD family transcriptional regulator